jgi:hypothetical protein
MAHDNSGEQESAGKKRDANGSPKVKPTVAEPQACTPRYIGQICVWAWWKTGAE